MNTISTPEIQNMGRVRRSPQASRQRLLGLLSTLTVSTAATGVSSTAATKCSAERVVVRGVEKSLDIADPRVENGVEQVDQDVDDQVEQHHHGDEGDDRGPLAADDGVEEGVADAGDVEDALGHGRADDEDAEVRAELGGHRDQ